MKMGVKTTEDPYASMEKDQLISMIHFLVKREDERAQENQELKDMVKDLRTGSMRGELMNKALNYLKSFWNQLILYLKDGRYSIDNSLAERTLRPMTEERKNSLIFGSHDGAEVSVIYHTFIETCKMCGVSTLEYFKEFFKAIMQGRTDYENMLPMTIGIKNNKV